MTHSFQFPPPSTVMVHETAPLSPPAGRAIAANLAIIVMWSSAAVTAAQAFFALVRTSLWSDALDGRVNLSRALDADKMYKAAGQVGLAMSVAAIVALMAWSSFVAAKAQARGVTGIRSSGALAWLVPVIGVYLGIRELARAVRGVGRSTRYLTRFAIAMYFQGAVGLIAYVSSNSSFDDSRNAADVVAALRKDAALFVALTVIAAATAAIATTAIRHTERSITSAPPRSTGLG